MKDHDELFKVFLSAVLFFIAFVLTGVLYTELPFYIRLLCYLPAYTIVGFECFKEAFENIKEGEIFDENLLMVVATVGAIVMGDFPEAVFVMLFFKIGEMFEDAAREKSKKSLDELLKIRPDKARVIKSGKEIEKEAKDVAVGEMILVNIGERIPLDGTITSGNTEIDTSAVTGESVPRAFRVSDKVFSGTVNLTSPIKVKVGATAEESA